MAIFLFLATGLAGAGLSLYPIAWITALSDLYSDRLGRALGVTMATSDILQTVLPPIAGVLAVALAWQVGLTYVLPMLIPIALVIWLTVPEYTLSESGVDHLSAASIKSVFDALRQPALMIVGMTLFLTAFYPIDLIEIEGAVADDSEWPLQFVFRYRGNRQVDRWAGA